MDISVFEPFYILEGRICRLLHMKVIRKIGRRTYSFSKVNADSYCGAAWAING